MRQKSNARRPSIGTTTQGFQRHCCLDQTYALLTQIRQARTAAEVCTLVLGYTAGFGVTGILAGVMPPPGSMRQEQLSHVLLDAWPREWALRYFSEGYLHHDPTIILVRRVSEAFVWSEINQCFNLSPSSLRVMQEAREFRLSDGLTLTFSSLERRPIGFSVAGERLELDPSQRQAIGLVAAYALAQAIDIRENSATQHIVRLSPRQLDVLRWACEGLTVDEIAERLKISSHTADTHLRAVRERLGVTTTIQAVAEAFRVGLIN